MAFYGGLLLYLVHFVMWFLWNWVIRGYLVYLYLAPQNWSHITQVHKTLESWVERTPGPGTPGNSEQAEGVCC